MRLRKDPSRRRQLQWLWSRSLEQPSKAGAVVAVDHNLPGLVMPGEGAAAVLLLLLLLLQLTLQHPGQALTQLHGEQ